MVRVVGLAFMASNQYGGLILIVLSDILFFIIDIVLYRLEKLNLKLYIAERALTLISFMAAILSPNATTLLGLMGTTMALIFCIKIYYTAITTKEFIDEHKLA